jgi:hypothetical protein
MRRLSGWAKGFVGVWLAVWPVYLCATWVLLGSVTAAFDTWMQVAGLVLLAIAIGLSWRRLNRLAKIGGLLVVASGLTAYAAYLLGIADLKSSETVATADLLGSNGSAPIRLLEIVALFVYVGAFFVLLFGALGSTGARRAWLSFALLYSAAIWAWTNFTGTKLLDGTVQRLFDLAILQALFTLSTLLIGLVLVIDLVTKKNLMNKYSRLE